MSRIQDIIQRSTRALQPLATAVSIGTLYYVTDEHVMERSTGAAWQSVSDTMTGDSGTGGLKGLVPAPGAGDTAAGKYLKAGGTWATPPNTGGWDAIITKANSDTVTNSTTLTADSELTFAVTAGVYEIHFAIWHECDSLRNFKWVFAFPAVDNVNLCIGEHTTYSTGGSITMTVAGAGSTTNWPTSGGVIVGEPATGKKIPIYGRIVVTIASAGNFVFQFAQGSAALGTSVIVRPGSTVRYKKLA